MPQSSKTSFQQKICLIGLGIFLAAAGLEVSLRLGGWLFFVLQESRNRISSETGHTYRILCLGESTTGLGGESSYPSQLEEILNNRSSDNKFKVINKGLPSSTTGTILLYLEGFLNKYQPDIVVTMIGANDSEYGALDMGRWSTKIKLFLEHFRIYKLYKLLNLHASHKIKELQGKTKGPLVDYRDAPLDGGIEGSTATKSSQEITALQKRLVKSTLVFQRYAKLSQQSRQEGDTQSAKEHDKKARKMQGYISDINLEMARWHRDRGEYDKATEFYRMAINIDPENAAAFAGFGRLLKLQNKPDEAIVAFRKAVELEPAMNLALSELGRLLAEKKQYEEAIKIYQKLLTAPTKDYWVPLELGRLYKKIGRYSEAEKYFKETIVLNPKNFSAHDELTRLYLDDKRYEEAERFLKDAIAVNPNDDRFYESLARCYEKQGKIPLAKEFYKKAQEAKTKLYPPLTIHHYRELAGMLHERKIPYVCMQYPVRSIEPLKMILQDSEDISFVSNEENFKEALKSAAYSEYFTDYFAGDFGHCTHKGNRLIAENLADSILNFLAKK